jgi:hypothetical protein
MKRLVIPVVVVAVLAGCASDPARRERIIKEQSGRLPPPTVPLSSYGKFELKPIAMAESVANDEAKAAVAKDLERRMQERMQPVFARWNADAGSAAPAAHTLVVQPRVTRLRVVGGATRFFAGAWAGESSIAMDLELRDADTGAVVASPSIGRSADAMAGAWSVGATDQNLLNYIADIALQYLQDQRGDTPRAEKP